MPKFSTIVCLLSTCLGSNAFAQDLSEFDDLEDLEPIASGLVDGDPSGDELLTDDGLDALLGDLGVASTDGLTVSGAAPSALESWKGFFELRPRAYFKDRGGEKNDEQLLLEAEFEMDFRLSEEWRGYFRPRVFLDALDGDLERFEPYEAYLSWAGEDWDLRAGMFIENWGIVDTFNPIDVINRRDFATDFLDADRLGELGVRARWLLDGGERIGEPTISFYALPVWRETRFATEDQRFNFGSGPFIFNEAGGFEPEGEERSFYAARFASTLNTAPLNADVQLLVSHGPERTPNIIFNGLTSLVPAYFGATTVGAGFRAVMNEDVAGSFLSTLTLKAEVVYKDPFSFDDAPIEEPDDYVAYVVGLDRQFFDVFKGQDSLTMTVEYAGEEGADDPASLFRPFRNDVILRGLWEANDFARSSIEARGILDFDTDETIFEGIFERQLRAIHEDLKLTVQFQFFDAPETGDSLFDFFPDNSSLVVGLRLDF